MTISDELAYLSAADLAHKILRRELSPVEVVDAFIERIEARNPSITALVYFGFDDAREAAKKVAGRVIDDREGGVRASRAPLSGGARTFTCMRSTYPGCSVDVELVHDDMPRLCTGRKEREHEARTAAKR